MNAPTTHSAVAQQVLGLLARYAHAMDDHRIDEVLALFHPDAVVDLPGAGVVSGHESLRELWGSPGDAVYRHLFMNAEVTAEDDAEIHVVSDLLIVGGSPWQIRAVGRYTDVLSKGDAGLLFKRRELRITDAA